MLLLVSPVAGQQRAALEARVHDLQARVDAIGARIRLRDSVLDAGAGWDVMPGQPSSAPYVPAGAPVGELAAAIASAASEALWYQVDRPLARWHPAAPLAVPASVLARRTFVELVTSDFRSVASCLGGGLEDCHRALGLLADPADLVGQYAPEDRQAFVRRLAQGAVGERAGLVGQ